MGMIDTEQCQSDYFRRLPLELRGQIFSQLSLAALDSARFVCQSWHSAITRNAWIIRNVLADCDAAELEQGWLEPWHDLRGLLREFDKQSAVPYTFDHSDSWRTRFRICDLDFSIPAARQELKPPFTRPFANFIWAKMCFKGSFIALLVQEETQRSSASKGTVSLILYHLIIQGNPIFIGRQECPEFDGISPIGIIETHMEKSWFLELTQGSLSKIYSIRYRDAWSRSTSPFSFTEACVEKRKDFISRTSICSGVDYITASIGQQSQPWKLLACLSSCFDRHGRCLVPQHDRHDQLLVVASNSVTYIYLVIGELLYPGRIGRTRRGVALLVPPTRSCLFRNLVGAKSLESGGAIRLAIIWQEAETNSEGNQIVGGTKPVLYIYEIPEVYLNAAGHSLKDSHLDIAKEHFANVHEKKDPHDESLRSRHSKYYHYIQGKRVTSVAATMGGVHPLSPFAKNAATGPETTCASEDVPEALNEEVSAKDRDGFSAEHNNAAYEHRVGASCDLRKRHRIDKKSPVEGGMYIVYSNDVGQMSTHKTTLLQKCWIWGTPNIDRTRIKFKVYDLSFTHPKMLIGSKAADGNPPMSSSSRNLRCACSLHDDGYHVVLPEGQFVSKGRSNWNLLPWRRSSPEPDVGTIEHYDSPAQKAAWGRHDEYLRERIREMKKAGITTEEVEKWWGALGWTGYGLVKKPDGWRDI